MTNEEAIRYVEKKIEDYIEIRDRYLFGDPTMKVIQVLINNAKKKLEELKDG